MMISLLLVLLLAQKLAMAAATYEVQGNTLREIDAKHFFGRESEFQRLVGKVHKATHTDDKVELVNLNKIELGLSKNLEHSQGLHEMERKRTG
jgi:hypothetical protein